MADKGPKKRAKPRSAHKQGRSYRWGGQTHDLTKYRARHGIPKDAKRRPLN